MSGYRVTTHAALRYCARVRPHLSVAEARSEIRELLLENAVRWERPPEWCQPSREHAPDFYLVVSGSLAFPVVRERTVTTCMVRGGAMRSALLRAGLFDASQVAA